MDTCLYCKEPITQTVGKRKRMFCSNYCRSRHWAKKEIVPDSWQEKYYNLKALYDPLLIRVAELEGENKGLKQRIDYLEPSAASHQQRMQSTIEAIKTAPKQVLTTSGDSEAILLQIKAIKEEKIPKERDTLYGRKAWQQEQNQKIEKLQEQLNTKTT